MGQIGDFSKCPLFATFDSSSNHEFGLCILFAVTTVDVTVENKVRKQESNQTGNLHIIFRLDCKTLSFTELQIELSAKV